MKKTNVVHIGHMGQIRELAHKWDDARRAILAGRIKGFQLCVIKDDGTEIIHVAGSYRENPKLATRAALRMSAARALAEDELPKLTGTD